MKYFILFYEGALPIMFSNFECIFKINLFSLPNTNISPSITPPLPTILHPVVLVVD